MATYGFIFRDGHLDLRIEHRGVERFVSTRYEIRPNEWNAETGELLATGHTARSRRLSDYQRTMERDLRRLRTMVNGMERSSMKVSADDIASAYRQMMVGYQMLGIYTQILAEEMIRTGKMRTARGYITTIRRFIELNRGYDIRLDELTSEVIARFEVSLQREGLTPPTISFYMRNLRAIYNKAVSENIILARLDSPFEDAYTYIELPTV